MANENNDKEYEATAPKKADVLIRSTQRLAAKQDEMSEQNKLILARLDELAEIYAKSNQDSTYIVKQSSEIFSQLQSENAALKQELLYLAKQSENIYAGLAEKITEISDRAKTREDAMSALVDRVNEVSQQNLKSEDAYLGIVDQLAQLSEQYKNNERLFTELNEKLDIIAEQSRRGEYTARSSSERVDIADVGGAQLIDRLNYISEQLRRSEGAHSVLADKFEILSMRVEQFGFANAKGTGVAAAPVQEVTAEIDYDKLAQKVADIVASREVISPDYIASKVAEQVVIPEIAAENVRVSVDTQEIARQVVELIDEKGIKAESTAGAVADVNIDEDALADRIVEKISGIKTSEEITLNLDEDGLAEKIAQKLGGVSTLEGAAVSVGVNEEELADSIALKVGSLKAEDFEILVDDEGCTSISKEIADKLDYETISNKIAQNLREVLDLAALNAPDYDEMAERISEKITVAGINEAAIADKAAAALSNYLPEIDTDEIAEKVTDAVIDVVNAMPQPTIDSETICNTISERLINSQEEHDYDVVLDEEGISKISEIVTEEIRNGTNARFDKVEENIAKLCELVNDNAQIVKELAEQKAEKEVPIEEPAEEQPDEDVISEEAVEGQSVEETVEEAAQETVEETVEEAEETQPEKAAEVIDYTVLSEVVAAEIEKGTGSRFDKVEEDIAKLYELVSSVVVEEVYDDAEDGTEEGEVSEESEEEYVEDYTVLSEVVANEIEKGVASRLAGLEESVSKIKDYIASEGIRVAEAHVEEVTDYVTLSEVVANEIERGISFRLDAVEENLVKVTEIVEANYNPETSSAVIAAEIERGIQSRFDVVEENLIRITEIIEGGAVARVISEVRTPVQDSPAACEGANEKFEKLHERLDKVDGDIVKLCNLVEGAEPIKEDVTAIKEMLSNGAVVVSETATAQPAMVEEEEEPLVTVSDLVEDVEEEAEEETAKEPEPAVEEPVAEEAVLEPVQETAEAQPAVIPVVIPAEEEEGEEEKGEGFDIDVLDMDAFGDDELMPGEYSDYKDGVDFANMMKYKRSFIARIIQSSDEYKQYYGEIKHALLSYKKVNSNVAWGSERFNKGRETIARLKIRGKTLCVYLALDPNNYKTSVYHHADVSDNNSVEGTPMMVKVKSPLGVKKAIRLINEMLALRNGEKREIPERNYAAMYPYETIEELIEEGLVKDVRKK